MSDAFPECSQRMSELSLAVHSAIAALNRAKAENRCTNAMAEKSAIAVVIEDSKTYTVFQRWLGIVGRS